MAKSTINGCSCSDLQNGIGSLSIGWFFALTFPQHEIVGEAILNHPQIYRFIILYIYIYIHIYIYIILISITYIYIYIYIMYMIYIYIIYIYILYINGQYKPLTYGFMTLLYEHLTSSIPLSLRANLSLQEQHLPLDTPLVQWLVS